MEYLNQHIESLIFAAETPISIKEIKACLEQLYQIHFKNEVILKSISQLQERYAEDSFAIEIIEISGGYQFFTKGAYHKTVGEFLKLNTKKKLSRAALETISIIAYKQPTTKSELENIRGVSCDYTIQKLLEKELVAIVGRSDSPGRPLLYGTSDKFMDYFGLKSLKDLPKLKDFKEPENTIGEPAPIEVEKANLSSNGKSNGQTENQEAN